MDVNDDDLDPLPSAVWVRANNDDDAVPLRERVEEDWEATDRVDPAAWPWEARRMLLGALEDGAAG